MTIHLTTLDEANELIRQPSFQAEWQKLWQSCSWSTAFQSPQFVKIWYESYKEKFSPLLLWETGSDSELSGLLTLAVQRSSENIAVAGAHQAEYQAWLASPETSNSFIENSLYRLQESFPNSSLTFRYLPVGTPTTWIAQTKWNRHCALESWRRPIVDLSDSAAVTEYLTQKRKRRSTRSYFNQLKRMGALRFD